MLMMSFVSDQNGRPMYFSKFKPIFTLTVGATLSTCAVVDMSAPGVSGSILIFNVPQNDEQDRVAKKVYVRRTFLACQPRNLIDSSMSATKSASTFTTAKLRMLSFAL